MARFVELRRHTDNAGDVLTAAGVTEAVRLGAALSGVYSIVYSSGAQRATQAAAGMLAGLGDSIPGGVVVEPRLRSEREGMWREVVEAAGSGEIGALLEEDPSFVAEEADRLGSGLQAIISGLGHGEMALAVGHSPTNEAAVYGLTGLIIEPMAKGAGVVLVEDAGGFRVEKVR